MKKQLYTVLIFTRLNTRRFFRDRLALFFGIMFPLIFLFVFGGISGKSANDVSFKVAVINQSNTAFAKQFTETTKKNKVFKVDETIKSLDAANDKMNKSQLDGTIVLPPDFGKEVNGAPTGQARILYTSNNDQAGQTLTAIMQTQFKGINSQFASGPEPFSVTGVRTKNKALTSFDYTFAGLLGFSILGIGIFGPINVFPELKKQGILRRFHTTPIKVWQYFVATVFTQIATGLVGLAAMFAAALTIFHLNVLGNYFEIILFLIFSITLILGVGLAVGGWAKTERQAAPLANIIVFPMMFLSGTFFPRFLMPTWLQHLSDYLPLTPVIDGVRFMTTEGKHLIDLGPQLGIMAVWMIVIYFIAFRVFRWE